MNRTPTCIHHNHGAAGARKREQVKEAEKGHQGVRRAAVGAWTLVDLNASGLVTSLVIAFGVLLVLAKDGIPISGWHQAVALGIGLAVLTDDQVLTKIG